MYVQTNPHPHKQPQTTTNNHKQPPQTQGLLEAFGTSSNLNYTDPGSNFHAWDFEKTVNGFGGSGACICVCVCVYMCMCVYIYMCVIHE